MKYPVRAAMNPFASTIGYLFPFVVSGSIIVSLVLSLPTVGPLLYQALIAQDLFLAGTILLLLASLDCHRHLCLRPDPDVDRPAHSPRHGGKQVMAEAVGTSPTPDAPQTPGTSVDTSAEDRSSVATQWQLMWWRFRKHKLAMIVGRDHHPLLRGCRLCRFPCLLRSPQGQRTTARCSRPSPFTGSTKASSSPTSRA